MTVQTVTKTIKRYKQAKSCILKNGIMTVTYKKENFHNELETVQDNIVWLDEYQLYIWED